MTASMRGNVMDNTAAQNRHVATAQAIPTSVHQVSYVWPVLCVKVTSMRQGKHFG